mgnify:CR=1 FL=1
MNHPAMPFSLYKHRLLLEFCCACALNSKQGGETVWAYSHSIDTREVQVNHP